MGGGVDPMNLKQTQMPQADQRARIDRRAWFGCALFLLAAGLSVLMERMGLPERLLELIAPLMALGVMIATGFYAGSMRISDYYAGGRAVPELYLAAALVSLATGLGLSLWLSEEAQAVAHDWLFDLGLGLILGLLLVSLITGPMLRACAAVSLVDMLTQRFPHTLLRVLLVVTSALIGFLIAWAAYSSAVDILSAGLGLSRNALIWGLAALLILLILPGGLRALIWTSVGVGVIGLTSLALPLAIDLITSERAGAVFNAEGFVTGAAAAQWLDFKFSPYDGLISHGLVILTLALGIACLSPILSPSLTSTSQHQARRGTLLGLAGMLALMAVIGLTALSTSQSLNQRLEGQRPERLPPALLKANGNGLISLCGEQSADPVRILAACRTSSEFKGTLRSHDIQMRPLFLLIVLSSSKGWNAALSGLVATSLGLMALMTAGAGALSCAIALSQDAFHRLRDQHALSSRRLAITRLCFVMTLLALTLGLSQIRIDAGLLAGGAIGLASLILAPLTVLMFWPRANSFDACSVIAVSLGVSFWPFVETHSWPDYTRLFQQALIGAGCGLSTALLTSFLHARNREPRNVPVLLAWREADTAEMIADKGA